MKKKYLFYKFYVCSLLFLIVIVSVLHSKLSFDIQCKKYKPENEAELREFQLGDKVFQAYGQQEDDWRRKSVKKVIGEEWDAVCSSVLADFQNFPVKNSEKYQISYENSWMEARTYGGKRGHEGCDLMPASSKAGVIPVCSVSDGVVEKKGWLEQGGYRLGIRSSSGAYFYYAHLYEYAKDIKVGKKVKAGEVIGTMGDSGYGKEGTTGQFPVHLHFGIYVEIEGREKSINPYYVLKYIENKQDS